MTMYDPDLTGTNVDYLDDNYSRVIFTNPQKIKFDIPIYDNSNLVITQIGTTNVNLIRNTDYIIQSDDIHTDDMSQCKLIDSSFSGILLKSITIIKYVNTQFTIQVKANRLFADPVQYQTFHASNSELEVTADLIASMLQSINRLESLYSQNNDTYSEESSDIRTILTEDPDCNLSSNIVTGETHTINTLSGVCYIRPVYGAFFKDSVTIVNKLNGIALTSNEFQVLDPDLSKTRISSNKSGVYNTIKIKKTLSSQVDIGYHCYGGTVDPQSFTSIRTRLESVVRYLANANFLTDQSIASNPYIANMADKLGEIQTDMRILLKNGIPNYGDLTNGTSILRKISAQDNSRHWWSIATLYRVDGSTGVVADNVTADTFRFRLQSLISNIMLECAISANANNTKNRISITCANSIIDDTVLNTYCPMFRVIEVKGTQYSGLVLQIGMKLGSGVLNDTIAVEDLSGKESCWKLVTASDTAIPPQDTGITMPNGTSTYTTGDTNSVSTEITIPFVGGVNILNTANNIPLTLRSNDTDPAVLTSNYDLIYQNVNNYSLADVRFIRLTGTVNISTQNAFSININLPVVALNQSNRYLATDTFSVDLGFAVLTFKVVLYYQNGQTTFRCYCSGNSNSNTINLTNIRLLF